MKFKSISRDYEKFHYDASIQRKIIKDKNFTYRLIINTLNKYLKKFDKVLDIGCGVGTLDLFISRNVSKILGIDISVKAIKEARKSAAYLKLNNVKFDITNFPNNVPRGKFDFIIFTEVIEHLDDDDLALKQVYKLLKKNGIVLISTPSKNAPLYRLSYAKEFDKRVGHLRRYELEELVELCERNNLKVIETRKVEGIIRNFLFLSPKAGMLIRFIKFYISDLATMLDNLTIPIFGESNIIVVAKKM